MRRIPRPPRGRVFQPGFHSTHTAHICLILVLDFLTSPCSPSECLLQTAEFGLLSPFAIRPVEYQVLHRAALLGRCSLALPVSRCFVPVSLPCYCAPTCKTMNINCTRSGFSDELSLTSLQQSRGVVLADLHGKHLHILYIL
jgi:hypothetical protein